MILVSYDISDDKLRTKFNKYIQKFGHRLQYSLYEIDNGPTTLETISTDLKKRWENKFTESDSVMILKLSKHCKIDRYGYAKHDVESLVIF